MKLSLEWLSEFVTWKERNPHSIANQLTLSVAEVEEVIEQGALLAHCCVGKVLSIHKHPNADKLSIVEVDTDKGKRRVVCGGSNLWKGMLVALAHTGATVKWHGGEMMTLAKVKIRGEESEGMICAAEELDLIDMFPPRSEDGPHPIIDLSRMSGSPQLKVGTPLRQALGLTDTILDVSNTAITNRPDLFSHLGFARECVALGLASWKKNQPLNEHLPKPAFPKSALPFAWKVDAKDLIPYYESCIITIKEPGITPDWMVRRLTATGYRSISLPIDITNYVAREVGMPLHSFDADDLKGSVHFRTAKKGERLTTLDGIERPLPEGAVILSDDHGVFDLMGIMGGRRSETKDATRHIYLHAAVVDPSAIRRAIVATGHRTEAATVYEKGLSPITAHIGFLRAVQLFLELVPGAKIASKVESWGTLGKAPSISLSLQDITSSIGADIPAKNITSILEDIGCTVKPSASSSQRTAHSSLLVTPPLWRTKDLQGPHDLIEEIGRLYGYANVEPQLPTPPLHLPARDQRLHFLRTALKEERFVEIVPLSLVSAALLQSAGFDPKKAVPLSNPLSEDTALLHPSPLPSLLAHAQRNILLANAHLRTFHWAHVFEHGGREHMELSLLFSSRNEPSLKDNPLLHLTSSLLTSLHSLGYELMIKPTSSADSSTPPAFAHPGRTGSLLHQKTNVGLITELHPDVAARFDLPPRTAIATINLSALFLQTPTPRKASALPHFPAVIYDETVAWTHRKPVADLLVHLREKSSLLEDVAVADLYQKESKAPDYNLTLRFTYRSPERTLTEEEAKREHQKVLSAIGK